MRSTYSIQNDIDDLKGEITKVTAMTEREACEWGNVDTKADYLDACDEELACLERELQHALEDEEEPDYETLDPAFSSWQDFYDYMYH